MERPGHIQDQENGEQKQYYRGRGEASAEGGRDGESVFGGARGGQAKTR